MSSVNTVILVGRLGKDPEVRYMNNGDAVSNTSLATREKWKDKNTGESKELTEWHRVVFHRKLAEIVGEYCKKGSLIYVEGKLRTRKWQSQDGKDNYTTEIIANKMQMLGGREDGGSGNSAPAQQQRAPQQQQAANPYQAPVDNMDDSDIPF